jgi:eukaryotic-like serine/threonine-protein kinase
MSLLRKLFVGKSNEWTPPLPGMTPAVLSNSERKYRVYREMRGGMGIVYLALEEHSNQPVALKTFQVEKLNKQRFKHEALLWLGLGAHPNIVTARFVDELSGRVFVGLDYITPDDQGRNTLFHYLGHGNLGIEHVVRWSIQFCRGMEYVIAKQVACHRDLKPQNLMVSADGTLKITDFGLAGIFEDSVFTESVGDSPFSGNQRLTRIRVDKGIVCGTPGYIAPEVLAGFGANQQSDIYSFGVIMHQLATGDRVPFSVRNQSTLPSLSQTNSVGPLKSVFSRAIAAAPAHRYASFSELRNEIEILARSLSINIPPLSARPAEKTWADYNDDGIALNIFGEYELALDCLTKAIKLNPSGRLLILNNLAISYKGLGHFDQALALLDEILTNTERCSPHAFVNKGWTLYMLKRHSEAHSSFTKATELDPYRSDAWHGKGVTLMAMSSWNQANEAFDRALAVNIEPKALVGKAGAMQALGELRKSLELLDRAIEIDPDFGMAWYMKGLAHEQLGEVGLSISAFQEFLNRLNVKTDNLNCIMHAEDCVRKAGQNK